MTHPNLHDGRRLRAAPHVTRQDFAGGVPAAAELRLDVPGRSTAPLDLADDLLEPADPKCEVLVAAADGIRAHHLFRGDLGLPVDEVAAEVANDVLISLTVGEAHHFTVHTSEKLHEPAVLLHPRILGRANTMASGLVGDQSSRLA